MSAEAAKPDLTFVTLVHQSLRIDAARLASALAAAGPGDRPGRIAAIGAFYGQYPVSSTCTTGTKMSCSSPPWRPGSGPTRCTWRS